MDIWKLLGIHKLNTTAYHPQCNGMVECLNRTLKTALRNMQHSLEYSGTNTCLEFCGPIEILQTREKPSFLLFGMDCRTPTEAALLLPTQLMPTEVEDYQEEVILSLSSAQELAAKGIQKAQKWYKTQYDRKSTTWGDREATQAVLALARTISSGIPWESWCHSGQDLFLTRDPNPNTSNQGHPLSTWFPCRLLLVWPEAA